MGEAQESFEQDEWASAEQALKAAQTSVGSRGDGMAELVRLAHAGLVRARAGLALVHGRRPLPEQKTEYPLPQDFWNDRGSGANIYGGNWQSGTFSNELGAMHHHKKIEAFRVEFEIHDLLRWFEKPGGDPAPAPLIGPSGASRPPGSSGKVAVWHDFWMAAMKLLDDGDLDQFETQADLRRRLLADISDRLSDESIKPQAARIWYAFKERG